MRGAYRLRNIPPRLEYVAALPCENRLCLLNHFFLQAADDIMMSLRHSATSAKRIEQHVIDVSIDSGLNLLKHVRAPRANM